MCVYDTWSEQLDSCPAGRLILLEANEKMSLNGQWPLELDGAAVRRGHRVQFTVKMLPINADRGEELVPLDALIKLQWPGRRFWAPPGGPLGVDGWR